MGGGGGGGDCHSDVRDAASRHVKLSDVGATLGNAFSASICYLYRADGHKLILLLGDATFLTFWQLATYSVLSMRQLKVTCSIPSSDTCYSNDNDISYTSASHTTQHNMAPSLTHHAA